MAIIDGFHPQGDKIIVEEIKKGESRTAGGLILVDEGSREFMKARIVRVGTTVTNLNPGDIIMYQKGAGLNQIIGAKPYLWLLQSEVWLKIDEDVADEISGIMSVASAGTPESGDSKIITAN